jgi:hypothetical protein
VYFHSEAISARRVRVFFVFPVLNGVKGTSPNRVCDAPSDYRKHGNRANQLMHHRRSK